MGTRHKYTPLAASPGETPGSRRHDSSPKAHVQDVFQKISVSAVPVGPSVRAQASDAATLGSAYVPRSTSSARKNASLEEPVLTSLASTYQTSSAPTPTPTNHILSPISRSGAPYKRDSFFALSLFLFFYY